MTAHAPARNTKRQVIIGTAERLFAEHGYDATSTARIAHEAGVPSGLVFYHFATKLDLLLAIVHERPTPSEVLRFATRGHSVRERLRAVVAVMAEELEQNRAARIIVFREARARPEIASRAAPAVRRGDGHGRRCAEWRRRPGRRALWVRPPGRTGFRRARNW